MSRAAELAAEYQREHYGAEPEPKTQNRQAAVPDVLDVLDKIIQNQESAAKKAQRWHDELYGGGDDNNG